MGDMRISIPCPKCGEATVKMLSELEVNDFVVCPVPGCDGFTDLTEQEWRVALHNARQAADEFDPKP